MSLVFPPGSSYLQPNNQSTFLQAQAALTCIRLSAPNEPAEKLLTANVHVQKTGVNNGNVKQHNTYGHRNEDTNEAGICIGHFSDTFCVCIFSI